MLAEYHDNVTPWFQDSLCASMQTLLSGASVLGSLPVSFTGSACVAIVLSSLLLGPLLRRGSGALTETWVRKQENQLQNQKQSAVEMLALGDA